VIDGVPSGIADYIGMFAVTTGIGVERKEKEFAEPARRLLVDHAQGDRRPLAEAFAECLHERVRKDLWGYAPDER
jgi:5-methyltetrahydrofolate--homocysteine methyltransferase